MDALANFYNNLFGIAITVLGIIAAVRLVFLQILHSNFSYRAMLLSLKRISLGLYALLSVVVILLTGFGSLHFAMGAHDFVSTFDFGTSTFFKSDYTLIALLF